jgi:hypothetical protein
VNGPVIFSFPLGSSFTGAAPLTPRLVADFAAGFLYLDIHTAGFPDGEVRGQVSANSAAAAAIPMFDGWMMLMLIAAMASLAMWRMR